MCWKSCEKNSWDPRATNYTLCVTAYIVCKVQCKRNVQFIQLSSSKMIPRAIIIIKLVCKILIQAYKRCSKPNFGIHLYLLIISKVWNTYVYLASMLTYGQFVTKSMSRTRYSFKMNVTEDSLSPHPPQICPIKTLEKWMLIMKKSPTQKMLRYRMTMNTIMFGCFCFLLLTNIPDIE